MLAPYVYYGTGDPRENRGKMEERKEEISMAFMMYRQS
jgi:hypothetical protein